MTIRLPLSAQTARGIVGAIIGVWLSAAGCEPTKIANPFTDATGAVSVIGGSSGSGSSSSNGGSSASIGGGNTLGGAPRGGANAGGSTGTTTLPCTPDAPGARPHAVGNYDNLSCNKADCHVGEVGGWVYASANGYPWVGGATITITNQDGSKLTTTSAVDGFFDFGPEPRISSPYEVCVSKCPNTDCNKTTHTSTDCLSSGCHALPKLRIYVTSPDLVGTGGAPATGPNCKPPTSGGPYVHSERNTSATMNQPCINCHADPDYLGGFLYDGPTSNATVAEATILIKPASGATLTTVTGPDGMFFFGTNAIVTTAQSLSAPYTACVSKCPTAELCSVTNGHTTTADCGTCHDGTVTGKVYLR